MNKQINKQMKMFVFAGPNGSGKSTIVRDFFKDERNNDLPFVNADNIAKNELFYIVDLNKRNLKAAEVAEQTRFDFVETGTSFAYETVLSTDRHIKFLQEAKEKQNAFISTFYVTTNSSDINVQRVCKRVSEGGHDVPEDKIRKRWQNCMDLLPHVIEVSDFFALLDNSSRYQIITVKENGKNYIVQADSGFVLPKSLDSMKFIPIGFEDLKNLQSFRKIEGFSSIFKTCESGERK